MSELREVGIRELRQNAARIIQAAQEGNAYRITNHGKDTGVVLGEQPIGDPSLGVAPRRGATLDQVVQSGIYQGVKPAGYEREMLRIVEHGRDRSGRVGGE